MISAEVKNMSFTPGKELWVKGVPHSNPQRFTIYVGQDDDHVAVVCDVRFNFGSSHNVIVLNSRTGGVWSEEVRDAHFSFQPGQEFEVTITFSNNRFYINLHDGHMLEFPDRLDGQSRNKIWVEGDATIHGISLR
uniref:Galectin n=1 Tax=Anguilla anguilla TaxID=7936 RepID=A0A0E9XB00_ANGAN